MNPAANLAGPQLMATPTSRLAEVDATTLFQLKNRAGERLQAAKAEVEHVDHAIDLKYAGQAKQLRLAQGKDSGVVHFDDGEIRITADLPKKVDWDQAKLGDLVTRITAAGENPAQYVEISYRVSETKFNAWPESLRSQFLPARTLKVGKPAYRLALLSE